MEGVRADNQYVTVVVLLCVYCVPFRIVILFHLDATNHSSSLFSPINLTCVPPPPLFPLDLRAAMIFAHNYS
jgi:hypothetical protein